VPRPGRIGSGRASAEISQFVDVLAIEVISTPWITTDRLRCFIKQMGTTPVSTKFEAEPEMCRLGDQRKDFPLTRRLPRQVTRRIPRCLQAFPVDCPRAKLDLLARLSARTCNESPHYGKCLLIKAEAISLKSLQESGPTSLLISGN
jgi:hypothetical protein